MTLGDVATPRSRRSRGAGYSERARRSRASGCRSATSSSPASEADGITVTVPRSLLGAIRPSRARMARAGVAARQGASRTCARCRRSSGARSCRCPTRRTPRSRRWPSDAGRQSLSIALAEALRDDAQSRHCAERRSTSARCRRICSCASPSSTRTAACSAAGRDLTALQRELGAPPGAAPPSRRGAGALASARSSRAGTSAICRESVVVAQRPRDLTLYPCARRRRRAASTSTLQPPGPAAVALHRGGVRRLLLKALPQQAALIRERTLADRALVLALSRRRRQRGARRRLAAARRAEQAFELDPPVRTAASSRRASSAAERSSSPRPTHCASCSREILPLQRTLRRALEAAAKQATRTRAFATELAAQLAELVGPRMLTETPREWRAHLPRYLRAAEQRWQKRGQRDEPKLAAEVAHGGRAARALARRAARRRAVAGGDRRVPLAARGVSRVAVRAAARHRALGVGEAARAGVAQGARERVSVTGPSTGSRVSGVELLNMSRVMRHSPFGWR